MAEKSLEKSDIGDCSSSHGPSLFQIAYGAAVRLGRKIFLSCPKTGLAGRDIVMSRFPHSIQRHFVHAPLLLGGAALCALITGVTAIAMEHAARAHIRALHTPAEAMHETHAQINAMSRDHTALTAIFAAPPASDILNQLGRVQNEDVRFAAVERTASGMVTVHVVTAQPSRAFNMLRAAPHWRTARQSQQWADDQGQWHIIWKRPAT